MESNPIKLTAYSHGAGCGCKISPAVLSDILKTATPAVPYPALLVGNDTRDDAAVFAVDDENAVISTTDFFMPIVDDPHDFGGIASVNAISDVYAMGGTPIMAIAILAWPIDKLASSVANQVLEGARAACAKAGIPLAGGHSIDAPEPIFGLAVSGTVKRKHIKSNNSATVGCELYLTKPLGIGILTTAQKKGLLSDEHLANVRKVMLELNRFGAKVAGLQSVTAMTDVTGFGLLGHLIELCEGSGVSAHIDSRKIPKLAGIEEYIRQGAVPGGTSRNFESYGHKVQSLTQEQRAWLCDPQTSGGLLIAVEPAGKSQFLEMASAHGLELIPFGTLVEPESHPVTLLS